MKQFKNIRNIQSIQDSHIVRTVLHHFHNIIWISFINKFHWVVSIIIIILLYNNIYMLFESILCLKGNVWVQLKFMKSFLTNPSFISLYIIVQQVFIIIIPILSGDIALMNFRSSKEFPVVRYHNIIDELIWWNPISHASIIFFWFWVKTAM